MPIGRLEKVPLREIWPNEAWLASSTQPTIYSSSMRPNPCTPSTFRLMISLVKRRDLRPCITPAKLRSCFSLWRFDKNRKRGIITLRRT